MANRDIDINIRTSFDTEGGDQVVSENERLARSYERLAESARTTASSLGERDQDLLEHASQQTLTPQQDPFIRMGEFQGVLYTDVARQAVQAGDIDIAQHAMRRGYSEREPEGILNRVRDEIAQLRSAQRHALLEPDDIETEEDTPADTEMVPHRGRMARRLQQRIEDHISTISANIHAGRTGVAERSLSSAENYLEQLTAIEGNTEQLRELRETLSAHREAIEENTQRIEVTPMDDGGTPIDVEGLSDTITRMFMAKGLGGAGGIGGMVGQLGKFLGPWGIAATAATATIGAGVAASNWLRDAGGEARAEGAAFLDVGRQFQTGDPLMYQFIEQNFATREALAELSYTSRDAGAFAMRFGMPRGGEDLYSDTLAGLQLARFTGTDEGAVAGLFQGATRAGVMGPGGGEGLSRIMFQAVREGTREGVSTAETFEQMSRYFSRLESQGVTAETESAAAMMGIISDLAGTGSRALQGAAGATAAERLIGGITQTGQPGMEMIALQALGVGTSHMPSAAEVGLTGAMAEQYEDLKRTSPVMAGRFLLERAGTGQPELLRRLGAGFERTMGGRTDLEFLFGQQQLGLSQEQIAELRGEFGSIFGALQQDPDRVRQFMEGEIRDPQREGEGYFATNMGFMQERLDFLDQERRRLNSVAAATQEWVEHLDEARMALARGVAGLTEFKDHPIWWQLENQTRRDQASTAERSERLREQQRRQSTGEADLNLVPPPPLNGPHGPVSQTTPGMLDYFSRRLMPFAEEVDLTQEWGHTEFARTSGLYGGDGGHPGLDMVARRGGTEITAPYSGHAELRDTGDRGYGKHVVITGETGQQIILGHLADFAIEEGPVRAGQVVGRQGSTGMSTGPHLHFEWRDSQGRSDDPTWFALERQRMLEEGLLEDPDSFALGGYTGSGGQYEHAGSVHRGEFVMHQLATARHRNVLEQMRRGADEDTLIQALRQQAQPSEERPQSDAGEYLVRFMGGIQLEVSGSSQEAARSLQSHLDEGMRRWAVTQGAQWTQRAKRG